MGMEYHHNGQVLEWDNVDPKEQEIAVRSASKVGSAFWSYNLPLQFYRDEETKKLSRIVNYMPRKETCCELSARDLFENVGKFTEQDVRDVCDTSIAILKNLIRQIERFRDGKEDIVYYPNGN